MNAQLMVTGILLVAGVNGAWAAQGSHARLRAVPFTAVQMTDEFWQPRLQTNRQVTLPHNLKWCEETGRISNFAKAGGLVKGEHQGAYFNDSDVYKVLEGAAYTLAQHPDKKLEAQVDAIIDKIASAQQPDGYINSYYTLKAPDKRWTDLHKMHELYCGGHMFEAAVAYYKATGKRKLLDVSCKFADHIDRIFGPGKRVGYSGHEEIELALIKLYRATGEERYRKLAEFFVEVRGQNRDEKEQYCQAHLPVKEQSEIVGHAVRAMYLYSGVADIVGLTGDQGNLDAMERLWQNVTGRKMYLTGGIGATSRNEGFSADYELPNESAYAETCASIGMALWNHRLTMLHADARFADVLERVLYNGLLSGVSLDGTKFFYTNPLASRGTTERQSWFGCACCPTNVVRFLPSLGGYIYAEDDGGVWVSLYIGSTVQLSRSGNKIKLTQKTKYPWSGKVQITVDPAKPAEFSVHLRIPGWCKVFQVNVNGSPLADATLQKGYLDIKRKWQAGDVIELDLPMVIRRIEAHPRVAADRGRVALQRGPIVYCFEGVDHGGLTRNLVLPRTAQLTDRFDPKLLGGVVVLEGQGLTPAWSHRAGTLYQTQTPGEPVKLTGVPYYAWNNRGVGEMMVWLPEAVGLAAPPPIRVSTKAKGAEVTASYRFKRSILGAVNDGMVGETSHDRNVPKFSWWGHKGTKEWVAYKFDQPILASAVEVYWYDDSETGGGCSVPKSWRVLWKRVDQWEPVKATCSYGTRKDAWNRVTFEAVPFLELRLEVELQEGRSCGILEWRLP